MRSINTQCNHCVLNLLKILRLLIFSLNSTQYLIDISIKSWLTLNTDQHLINSWSIVSCMLADSLYSVWKFVDSKPTVHQCLSSVNWGVDGVLTEYWSSVDQVLIESMDQGYQLTLSSGCLLYYSHMIQQIYDATFIPIAAEWMRWLKPCLVSKWKDGKPSVK